MTQLSLFSKTEPPTEASPTLPYLTDQPSERLDDIFADRKEGELAPWEMTLAEWKENHIFIPVREGHGKSGNAKNGERNVQTTTDEEFSSLRQIAHEIVATGETGAGVTTIMRQILNLYNRSVGLNLFTLPNRKVIIMHDRELPPTVVTYHKSVVRQALAEGKAVPAKVLLPYPDLQPRVIDEEAFLTQNGASRQDIGECALHKNIPEGNIRKRLIEAQAAKDRTLVEKRATLREEYRSKIAAGEIRPPSRIEQLIATANGHPDNESVQAARRLLVKQGLAEGKNVPLEVLAEYPRLVIESMVKQPWEMNIMEFRKDVAANEEKYAGITVGTAELPLNRTMAVLQFSWTQSAHQNIVRQALLEGKPVPAEVLANYPSLLEQKAEEEEAVPEPTGL